MSLRPSCLIPRQLKVVEQDGRPPVNPTDQVAITVFYYTDRPLQGPVPESLNVTGFDVLSPFALGDTIIMNTVSYPIGVDGIVTFDLDIPESAATATIRVSDSVVMSINNCFS